MSDSVESATNQVGRYRLVERLAVGGMAEIFLACEKGAHDFERLVVIKKMLPHLQDDDQFIQMFLQEARICARINHPNVVHIIEFGEHSELPFMAMEYVDGSTLRELLVATDKRRYHLPYGVAVDLMAQAIAGAHAVHELEDPSGKPYNLVHRDISPHNLMVTTRAHVKLLDFGIVKAEGGERTRTGVLKGKLSYMSPEQCHQGELDRRSDIYALGICTWEALAGQKLFSGKSELQIMQSIVTGKVRDLGQARPDVPAALQRVVKKALMPKAEDRYATADDMRRALLSAAQEAGVKVDADTSRDFIKDMLGDKHTARKAHVSEALDRTLVTASGLQPLPMDRRTSLTTAATQVTRYGVAGLMGGLAVSAGGAFFAVALVALALVLAYTGGLFGGPDTDAVSNYVVPDGEVVEIRFAPTIDAPILLDELEPFRRYLEQNLHQPVVFSVGEDYADTAHSVVSGDVQFASLPPAMTMMTVRAHPDIELLAVKLLAGSTGTDGVLLVNEDAGINSVADMRGKTICYPDVNSTTGYVLPRVYLRSQGIDPDVDLVQVPPRGNHLEVIRGIVDGTCDLGGVYRGALDEADDKGIPAARTRMLGMTGRTPHDAIAAGPTATPEQRVKLRQALLALDTVKEFGVEHLGEMEKLSGWVEPDQTAYDRLSAALDEEEAIRDKKAGEEP